MPSEAQSFFAGMNWLIAILAFASALPFLVFPSLLVKKLTDPSRKKKTLLMLRLTGVILLGMSIFAIFENAQGTKKQAVSTFMKKCRQAQTEMENSPPGAARVEKFIRNLKTIETASLPPDIRNPFNRYIGAMENGVAEIRAGQSPEGIDAKIGLAKKDFVAAVQRYVK